MYYLYASTTQYFKRNRAGKNALPNNLQAQVIDILQAV
jgi:hypothetical protein